MHRRCLAGIGYSSLLGSVWCLAGCAQGGFDVERLDYADLHVVLDAIVQVDSDPDAETCFGAVAPSVARVRSEDGHFAFVPGLFEVSFASTAGETEWMKKYQAVALDLPCLVPTTAPVGATRRYYLVELARADLNRASWWLSALGNRGTVEVSDKEGYRGLALLAQMRVEDTRKVRVSPVTVGAVFEPHEPGPSEDTGGVADSTGEDRARRSGVPAHAHMDGETCGCIDEGAYEANGFQNAKTCGSHWARDNDPPAFWDAQDEWNTLDCATVYEAAYDEHFTTDPDGTGWYVPPPRDDALIVTSLYAQQAGSTGWPDNVPSILGFPALDGAFEYVHLWIIADGPIDEGTGELTPRGWIAEAEGLIDDGPSQYDKSCRGPGILETMEALHRSDGYSIIDDTLPGSVTSDNHQCEFPFEGAFSSYRAIPVALDYHDYVVYRWHPGETEVGLFIYAGDECMDLWLLGCVCNGDDPLGYVRLSRAATEAGPQVAISNDNVTLSLQTVTNCDCPGTADPDTECCDGRDNDCDGEADEADEMYGMGGPCGSDLGQCEQGEWACPAGLADVAEPGVACTCAPLDDRGSDIVGNDCPDRRECSGAIVSMTGEICGDLEDNDCDGSVDEGFGDCCDGDVRICAWDVGECTTGGAACAGGGWDECVRAIGPVAESDCNGLDDDCDGSTDEYVDCGCTDGAASDCGYSDVGACAYGEQACEDGAWDECDIQAAQLPTQEICNGVDDDCNGLVDDGPAEYQYCTISGCMDAGVPGDRQGISWCVGGQLAACDVYLDAEENHACNGIDDDCDGEADEIAPITCGVGACAVTITSSCDCPGTGCSCDGVPTGIPRSCPSCDDPDGDYNCNGVRDGDETSVPEGSMEACIISGIEEHLDWCAEDCSIHCVDGCDNDCDGGMDATFGSTPPMDDDCFEHCWGLSGG